MSTLVTTAPAPAAPTGDGPAPAVARVEVASSRFPSVNLLPETVHAALKARRARFVVVVVAGVAVLLVGGLYALAQLEVSSAQTDYETALARGEALKRESMKYAEVPTVTAELAEATATRALAMADEVRWSAVMTDVAEIMPPGVTLTELGGTLAAAQKNPGATAPGAAASAATAGSMTFAGEAVSFDAVARWLDVLGAQKIFVDPFSTGMQRSPAADNKPSVLSFTSTSGLGEAALSHRFSGATETRGAGS